MLLQDGVAIITYGLYRMGKKANEIIYFDFNQKKKLFWT